MYPKIGLREFVEITSDVIPIAGSAILYTSGWPRNQNKCWNKIGLPPSLGKIFPLCKKISLKKKLVPRWRSNNNKTTADNNTGKVSTPKIAVNKNDQTVKGSLVMYIPFVRIFKTVTI